MSACFACARVLRAFFFATPTRALRVNGIKPLTTCPEGNSEFDFPRTSRFEESKIHCFPRDQSLGDLLYSFLRSGKLKHSLKNPPSSRGKHQSRDNHATFCHGLITCSSGQQRIVTV